MPNILKCASVVSASDTVKIPDIMQFVPTDFSQEKNGAEESVLQEKDTEKVMQPNEQTKQEDPQPLPEPVIQIVMRDPTPEEIYDCCRDEIEQLKQKAYDDAYFEAIRRKRVELQTCIDQVQMRLDEMQAMQHQYMEQYANELKFLAIEIAEKVLLQKIQENDLVLQKLVLHIVGTIKNSDWITVEVSEQLVHLVEALKEELAKEEYHGHAEVSATATPIDTVKVHTPTGTTVGSILVQTDHLRTAFEDVKK